MKGQWHSLRSDEALLALNSRHSGLSETEAIADLEKFITLTDNPQWIEEARQEIEELFR